MSEQAKSNFQVIGAGVLGFVAVVGGAFAVMSQLAPRPVATAGVAQPSLSAPDALSAPAAAPRSLGAGERRQASPQPLLGAMPEDAPQEQTAASAASVAAEHSAAGAAASAAASPESLGALGAPRHSGKGESVSTARAEVKRFESRTAQSAAPAAAPAAKPMPRLKLDNARTSIASSVHYGVTSRAELMGNAAGPVYNFKGGKGGADAERVAALTKQAGQDIDALEKQIDANDALTPEQKAHIKKTLGQKK